MRSPDICLETRFIISDRFVAFLTGPSPLNIDFRTNVQSRPKAPGCSRRIAEA
jgi:hypothetical protein